MANINQGYNFLNLPGGKERTNPSPPRKKKENKPRDFPGEEKCNSISTKGPNDVCGFPISRKMIFECIAYTETVLCAFYFSQRSFHIILFVTYSLKVDTCLAAGDLCYEINCSIQLLILRISIDRSCHKPDTKHVRRDRI